MSGVEEPGSERDVLRKARPPRRRRGLLALDALAAATILLALAWITLPAPLPLASTWPETTAYIELRRADVRSEGRELEVRWEPVSLARIPEQVERAVRVAEDAYFYRHGGVDWSQVRAAIREWWTEEEGLRGASTITMQLARNLYLSPERSWIRKARETLLAYRLEARLPKRRILELYLNVVELGPGVFGVEAASRHYWSLPVSGLNRRRSAELAATLPSPLEDNPRTRTPRFRWRADLIHERAFGSPAEPPGSFPAEPAPSGTGDAPGDDTARAGARRPPPSDRDTVRPLLPAPDTAPGGDSIRPAPEAAATRPGPPPTGASLPRPSASKPGRPQRREHASDPIDGRGGAG